ncbi:MAG: EFR1 family ferrodoxin [Bacteroidota bacterium]|nr:EFR1 family ferrodoxin [Bacteroidota bacterium]
MKELVIFYFSGTGNARRVTEWFSDEGRLAGYNVTTINIAHHRMVPNPIPPQALIGFVSPTHGFNYPPLMLHFLFRFPHSFFRNKVFLMNTRAGMKMGKFFLPGLSGVALLLAALILRIKGYRITGMRSVDLPSNWISLHPGLKQNVVTSIFGHCEGITRTFARTLLNGRKNFRALLDLPQDLLITPIALGYYFIGRFVIAKTFVASRACNNCGLCIKQCPVNAISMVDNRPYWSYRCESCMKCMNNCPQRAIETAHGLLAVTILILNAVIFAAIYSWLPNKEVHISDSGLVNGTVEFTLQSAVLFLVLTITYRLAHYLKRFRWFDRLITYSSLTKYKFWRRYKAPG